MNKVQGLQASGKLFEWMNDTTELIESAVA